MEVVNLRIENKKLSTLESIKQKPENKDSVFKSPVVYPFKDPLFLVYLDIWINEKKVDTNLIEYLEIIILPGRKEVTANIKFTSEDYFIEGDKPEEWDNYKFKSYTKPEYDKYLKKSEITKLFEENSTKTIINGIPVMENNIKELSKGFDVEGYYTGLRSFVTKTKIILRPHSPLELEVTYAPTEVSINLNPNLDITK